MTRLRLASARLRRDDRQTTGLTEIQAAAQLRPLGQGVKARRVTPSYETRPREAVEASGARESFQSAGPVAQ